MEFELEKKYTCGPKTFTYLFMLYGWWLTLLGLALIVAAALMTFTSYGLPVQNFLAMHASWNITTGMLSEWCLLFGLAFIFFAYLRASVLHRYHKFIVDEHAFHLHRGWFSIRETTIPYRQISNVHVTRPYIYRMFGIVKLDIVTAADRDIARYETNRRRFLIPIIDKSVARDLSHYLLKNASKKRDRFEEEEDIENDFDQEEQENRVREKQYKVLIKNEESGGVDDVDEDFSEDET